MTKDEFVKWSKSKGWTQDKFGHLQRQIGEKQYRFKLSSIAVRYEVKIKFEKTQYSSGSSEWMRLRSGYFSKLSINEHGKLVGLKE